MAGRADVVFCLDVSGSMSPTIEGVCKHLSSFVKGLTGGNYASWDLRFGLLTHRAGNDIYDFRLMDGEQAFFSFYGSAQEKGKAFTTSGEEFVNALRAVKAAGDEATLMALDVALDFPWRDAKDCRRIVVLLTDEAVETGVAVERQVAKLPELIEKIQALRVMLYMVAPPSNAFEELSKVDKSEYIEYADGESDGLATVDFKEVLYSIGKSVSVSQSGGQAARTVKRALYGQDTWVRTDRAVPIGD